MAASKTQLTVSQLFFLTACQQLLLHTCDWLGLKRLGINTPCVYPKSLQAQPVTGVKRLGINTPCVPYRDVSLLYPAMHPQYVTITQQILSLKFSVAHKMQFRQYG